MLDNIESTEKDLQPKKNRGGGGWEAEEEQGISWHSHMLSKLTDSFPQFSSSYNYKTFYELAVSKQALLLGENVHLAPQS